MTAGAGWRALFVAGIVLSSAVLALLHTPARGRSERVVDQPQHVARSARCRMHGAAARAHALSSRRLAVLHWQRAAFSAADAQRAVHNIAEAEACYRAAGDREHEAHAATLGRQYRAELGHKRSISRQPARDAGWLHQLALAMRDLP